MASSQQKDTVKLTITMPRDVRQALESEVPKRQRSAFIAQAVREALGKTAETDFLALLHAIEPIAAAEDSVETLRRIRNERIQRP